MLSIIKEINPFSDENPVLPCACDFVIEIGTCHL